VQPGNSGASKTAEKAKGSYCCCGLENPVWLEGWEIPANARVTVRLDPANRKLGTPVAPSEPREKLGLYWGYQVRVATDLDKVFSECPFAEENEGSGEENEERDDIEGSGSGKNRGICEGSFLGGSFSGGSNNSSTSDDIFKRKGTGNHFLQQMRGYDWVLGTSERGEDVHKELGALFTNTSKQDTGSNGGSSNGGMSFKHGLILFGGLGGLEDVIRDPLFHNPRKIKNPRDLCHHYVNIASTQTSRTIRAEEALMITLAQLSGYLQVHA
jgi:hypothetical protein